MKVNNLSARNLKSLAISIAVVSLCLLLGTLFFGRKLTLHHRQTEVAQIGSQVMPFDLEATTHEFVPLPNGGLQTVTADNPADKQQIELIQSHLKEESTKFQSGDFSDPAKIHGEDMPGLASLQSGFSNINVQYTPLANGGQIRYVTKKADLVSAIHNWFNAQRSDHDHHER